MSLTSWSDIIDGYANGFDCSPIVESDTSNAYLPEVDPGFTVSNLKDIFPFIENISPIDLPGEFESRTLIVSILPVELVFDNRLQYFIERTFGTLKDFTVFETQRIIVVQFFDLRHARAMRWSQTFYRGIQLQMIYGPCEAVTNPRKPPNNGTLVLFHVKADVSDSDLVREFGKYGRIREVRKTPQKQTQRFVEYWDTRDAEAALENVNGKYLFGTRMVLEFSLPGGYRKRLESATPTIERKTRSVSLQIAHKKSE
jgi:RNA recognition motif-containing protein